MAVLYANCWSRTPGAISGLGLMGTNRCVGMNLCAKAVDSATSSVATPTNAMTTNFVRVRMADPLGEDMHQPTHGPFYVMGSGNDTGIWGMVGRNKVTR